MQNVIEVLKSRGLFEDCTHPELTKFVESPRAVYAGFDPTSSSLQVGNFVTIMALAHYQRCGHKVAVVMGSPRNLKITTPADLELAEFYLGKEG